MSTETKSAGKILKGSLWLSQALIFLVFVPTAIVKLVNPGIFPWTGDVSPLLVIFTALVDAAGGIGILLPSLTRIKPNLTVWAAIGCLALQICAGVFHFSRGEIEPVYGNIVFAALAIFIWWGRSKRAPILPR